MAEAIGSDADGADPKRPRPRRELTLFQAVAGTVVVALLTAVAVLAALIWWLGLSGKITQSTSAVISLIQLSFALVAGVGAVTGLVIAYRKHQLETGADAREDQRLFNERFGTAATQLASDLPAIRLAGIYSMAGLADSWTDGRQQCIDVLCTNLRRAYAPEPPGTTSASFDADRVAWKDNQEFRHAIVRVVAERLRPDRENSWQGHSFDFTGATFDGGDFSRIHVGTGTILKFSEARFIGGSVSFASADIAGGTLELKRTQFDAGTIDFSGALLRDGVLDFTEARLSGGKLDFAAAQFLGGTLILFRAQFDGAGADFFGSRFLGSAVNLAQAVFKAGNTFLEQVEFRAGSIGFYATRFNGGAVSFTGSQFTGAGLMFEWAKFSGAEVDFRGAEFTGGTVDLSKAKVHANGPIFDFEPDQAPPGVLPPPGPITEEEQPERG